MLLWLDVPSGCTAAASGLCPHGTPGVTTGHTDWKLLKPLGAHGPLRQTMELLWTICNLLHPRQIKNTILFDIPWGSTQWDIRNSSCGEFSILHPFWQFMGKHPLLLTFPERVENESSHSWHFSKCWTTKKDGEQFIYNHSNTSVVCGRVLTRWDTESDRRWSQTLMDLYCPQSSLGTTALVSCYLMFCMGGKVHPITRSANNI